MTPEQIRQLHKDAATEAFDTVLQSKLAPVIGDTVAFQVKQQVEKLRAQRMEFGADMTGLSEKQKKDFASVVASSVGLVDIDKKANEALIEEQDNRGGYLVSHEIADAIVRIAASVGTIMSQ